MLANVALPSFFPHSILTMLGVLVIAAIEGFLLSRWIRYSFVASYKLSMKANLWSTFLGIPIAWGLWLAGMLPISFLVSHFDMEIHPVVAESVRQSVLFGGIMPSEWNAIGAAAGSLVILIRPCHYP